MATARPALSPEALRRLIGREAARLGFDGWGIAPADNDQTMRERLAAFIANGWHGSMDWMADTLERRADPQTLWPQARSVIMLAMNYGPQSDPLENLANPAKANISVYARNRDYHDVIKGRLKELAGKIAVATAKDVKVFVDTAPVMEKPLAQRAGLGWQGKHTNLVSRQLGSWFFLGCIFTEAALAADAPEADHCGSCRACLDACPTKAFPSPYQLDARRCISYLTIEHKGPIPQEFRKAIGNRIYGCDDCLAACPWNKFAASAREMKLQARADLVSPSIADFLVMDDVAFRARFAGSPVKRIGRSRFLRNVLIAAGNSADESLLPLIVPHLADPDVIVRGAAVWASAELGGQTAALRHIGADETDASVCEELARIATQQ